MIKADTRPEKHQLRMDALNSTHRWNCADARAAKPWALLDGVDQLGLAVVITTVDSIPQRTILRSIYKTFKVRPPAACCTGSIYKELLLAAYEASTYRVCLPASCR